MTPVQRNSQIKLLSYFIKNYLNKNANFYGMKITSNLQFQSYLYLCKTSNNQHFTLDS